MGQAKFLETELENLKDKFGERVAVKRRLEYTIGSKYERLATFGMGTSDTEGGDPRERAEIFAKAVKWYQMADETVGYLTDYSMRQAQSCFGFSHFAQKANLEQKLIQSFTERGANLIGTFLGQTPRFINDENIMNYFKAMAVEKSTGLVRRYVVKPNKNN